jgi:hypothetical protein
MAHLMLAGVRDALRVQLEALAKALELYRERDWAGASRRGASRDRDAGLEHAQRLCTERGVSMHQLRQRHTALDRVAHEGADELVSLPEGDVTCH